MRIADWAHPLQNTNPTARNTVFEETPPTQCRFVRLTMTDWPRTTPLEIIELTVFGKAADLARHASFRRPAHPLARTPQTSTTVAN